MGLNPAEGNPFVSVYIDDIMVFLKTLDEHLGHLDLVLCLSKVISHPSAISKGKRLSF